MLPKKIPFLVIFAVIINMANPSLALAKNDPVLAAEVAEEVDLGQIIAYEAERGNTVKKIAESFGLDVELIAAMNNVDPEKPLNSKQVIYLPAEQVHVHVVKKGDTLWDIADLYSVPIEKIIEENELNNSKKLKIGQPIVVPLPLYRKVSTEERQPSRGNFIPSLAWPVKGIISSIYGPRWGEFHEGLDIAADKGTPVRAAKEGEVIFAGPRGTYGKAVVIRHDNSLTTLYGHNSRVLVKEGDRVKAGQIIANVGSTGRSTGPHLHFEVRVDERPVNPLQYLTR